MKGSPYILFAGGGTGGHLFPGLAVAEIILELEPGCRIGFCGTGKDWERSAVSRAGFEYLEHRAAPFVASPIGLWRAVFVNGIGYRRARRIIRADRPDVVVGLGGYSSVPFGMAAARAQIPLVLLEQNAVPGRANRFLSRWASEVYLSYDESAPLFSPHASCVTTGNPIRRSIVERSRERNAVVYAERDRRPVLLILGGSQGAQSINRHMRALLPELAEQLADWEIVHQAGSKDAAWLQSLYASLGLRATVAPFISDMAEQLGRATLAIARAGATSLAELAVAGVPAILIPYPFAAAQHQWHNAQYFGRAGAAIVVDDRREPGQTAATLKASLAPLLRLPELRREMRLAMVSLSRPDAARDVASRLIARTRPRSVRQSA